MDIRSDDMPVSALKTAEQLAEQGRTWKGSVVHVK